jgi:hypothetical protein
MRKSQAYKARALYIVRCDTAWDGDAFGNEWTCGAMVMKNAAGFAVYEDDGEGNGNLLVTFALESDAREYADRYVKHLDSGAIDVPSYPDLVSQ